jgi:hypothetical protein
MMCDACPDRTMAPTIRPLRADDLPEADRIFRVAFGTFIGLPDPSSFAGDTDYVRTRFRTDPAGAFAADVDGRLAGTNFATTWGSVGFFGPLSVRPDLWDAGVAKRLLDPTMALFEARGCRLLGLFTFAQSAKHVGLYHRYGFWPRCLTTIMAKPVASGRPAVPWSLASAAGEAAFAAARAVTGAVYDGLDVTSEMRSIVAQGIGETVLVGDGEALAVCHLGAGSEAGSGVCFVKFGAATPGAGAAERFERLLDACEAFAAGRGLDTLVAGVNTACRDAWRRMLARGFRTAIQGVQMMRGDEPGYSRPDRYVLDDWR